MDLITNWKEALTAFVMLPVLTIVFYYSCYKLGGFLVKKLFKSFDYLLVKIGKNAWVITDNEKSDKK